MEIINPQIYIINYYMNSGHFYYIITIGTENSNIEIFDMENYENDLIVYNNS